MKKSLLATTLICILAYVMPAYAADQTADKAGSTSKTTATAPSKPQDNAPQPVCSRMDEIATVPPPSVINGENYPYAYPMKLGQYVTVQLSDDDFKAHFTKKENGPQPTPVLYLNGYAIKGLSWVQSGCHNFSFLLTRTNDSREVWSNVISKLNNMENVPVGIGTEQEGFIKDIGTARMELIQKGWLAWWCFGIIVLLIAVIVMGKCSGLLRDLPSKQPAGAAAQTIVQANMRPFSLGRMQMAFWFVLATGAYTYIWLRTGDITGTIPDSILTLMGISAGTTVLGAVVDSNSPAKLQETASGSFFTDILSDGDGISFHRFQMLVWTIILGGIFIKQVTATLIMPDFDTQLLGLMGISAGTYLGFKIPASNSPGKPT